MEFVFVDYGVCPKCGLHILETLVEKADFSCYRLEIASELVMGTCAHFSSQLWPARNLLKPIQGLCMLPQSLSLCACASFLLRLEG